MGIICYRVLSPVTLFKSLSKKRKNRLLQRATSFQDPEATSQKTKKQGREPKVRSSHTSHTKPASRKKNNRQRPGFARLGPTEHGLVLMPKNRKPPTQETRRRLRTLRCCKGRMSRQLSRRSPQAKRFLAGRWRVGLTRYMYVWRPARQKIKTAPMNSQSIGSNLWLLPPSPPPSTLHSSPSGPAAARAT